MKASYLLQADFSVSSSGDTYWAVPTNELALADEKRRKEGRSHTETSIPQCCTKGTHPPGLPARWQDCSSWAQHESPGIGLYTPKPLPGPGPSRQTPFLGALSSKSWLKGQPLCDTSPDNQGSPSRPPRRADTPERRSPSLPLPGSILKTGGQSVWFTIAPVVPKTAPDTQQAQMGHVQMWEQT